MSARWQALKLKARDDKRNSSWGRGWITVLERLSVQWPTGKSVKHLSSSRSEWRVCHYMVKFVPIWHVFLGPKNSASLFLSVNTTFWLASCTRFLTTSNTSRLRTCSCLAVFCSHQCPSISGMFSSTDGEDPRWRV